MKKKRGGKSKKNAQKSSCDVLEKYLRYGSNAFVDRNTSHRLTWKLLPDLVGLDQKLGNIS